MNLPDFSMKTRSYPHHLGHYQMVREQSGHLGQCGLVFFFLSIYLIDCTGPSLRHANSLVTACGIEFPEQRLNLDPLLWEHGVSAIGPSGKSQVGWSLRPTYKHRSSLILRVSECGLGLNCRWIRRLSVNLLHLQYLPTALRWGWSPREVAGFAQKQREPGSCTPLSHGILHLMG